MSNYQHPQIKIVTSKGDILCELFEDKAPNTVANIINLAESDFYKGMHFHRIIPGFMAQGGCPNTKEGETGMPGTGGPGYQVKDEFDSSLHHDKRGILSMANAGPSTNGSQFFITFIPTPHLNGAHTVFGQVIEGMDVLDKLESAGSSSGATTEPLTLNIEIVRKNDHPYTVEKI